MGSYVPKSSCCGSTKTVTKEQTACCDCPAITGGNDGEFNLACGSPPYTIFAGNTNSTVNGTIEVNPNSQCGIDIIVVSNGNNIPFSIPPVNDPAVTNNSNSLFISMSNVTSITVTCNSTGTGNCLGEFDFIASERCITQSPSQNIPFN
ncbi:S-Ena type endospore appendage [Cytobacillus sp. Hm23]